MERAENKAARLIELETLLLAHPNGMSQAELARRLGVHRSTVGRYLSDLPLNIYIDEDDDQRWKIDRQSYLFNVRFNLNEIMTIHLATRLLTTRMDRKNPHAAASLRKLGLAIEKLAPHISWHMQRSADEIDDESRKQDPAYLQTLERLTLAWAEQRKVHLWHRQDTGEFHEYDFSIYFIEPYAIGQSTYAIGLREPPGKLRTFKIERLERVEITDQIYQIPGNFDPQKLLYDAWGIWYTANKPITVVLHFQTRVVQRVLETRWHRSEKTTEKFDGSLIWSADIAEPLEMLPWIRGWGADVTVISPPELRDLVAQEAQRLNEIYSAR